MRRVRDETDARRIGSYDGNAAANGPDTEALAIDLAFMGNTHKRIHTIIGFCYLTLVAERLGWGTYGIKEWGQRFSVLFAAFRYIVKNTNALTPATLDEIRIYLWEMNEQYWHFPNEEFCAKDDEGKDIADFVVEKALMNRKILDTCQTFSYSTGQMENIQEVLISARRNAEREVTVYEATSYGIQLMLSTKEVFENLNISMLQLVTRAQLQDGEYKKALDMTENIQVRVRMEQIKVEEEIIEVRRNPEMIDESRYTETRERVDNEIDTAHEEFQEILSQVEKTRQTMIHAREAGQLSPKEEENLVALEKRPNVFPGLFQVS